MMFDYIIIGAGFAGTVLAERIASQLNKKVLIIEKRNHIAGNCFDYNDENGILCHKYGPHIFHTDYKDVWSYLSTFTEWFNYQHKVLASIDGKKVPIPFNINTIYEVFPYEKAKALECKLIEKYGINVKIPILKLLDEKDNDLAFLSDYVYNKVFLNYTLKQWGIKPEEISPEVTSRVPVFISKDDRYFQDTYQGLPLHGYTKLFENMLNQKNIKLMLNTDFSEVISLDEENKSITFMGTEFPGQLIFTGMIDELFKFKYGNLPYRSLEFQMQNHPVENFQEVATVNYPNNYDFTRITEFKHLTGQKASSTTIIEEYPKDFKYENGDTPYYPVFTGDNQEKYSKYKKHSETFENLHFIGRLAEYRYYDMDDIIKKSLDFFNNMVK